MSGHVAPHHRALVGVGGERVEQRRERLAVAGAIGVPRTDVHPLVRHARRVRVQRLRAQRAGEPRDWIESNRVKSSQINPYIPEAAGRKSGSLWLTARGGSGVGACRGGDAVDVREALHERPHHTPHL